jgi:neutral ceramidase
MPRSHLPTLMLTLSVLMLPSASSHGGTLSVGAARVEITPAPKPDWPPAGKYDHEKMYVRAIVLDNGATRAALVSADLPDITTLIWAGAAPIVAKELNSPVENLIISPTHSHSACQSGPPPPRFNDVPVESTVDAILSAVRQAKGRLRPAVVGFGTGKVYLNVNRDGINKETRLWTQASNPEGPSDKTLAVVLFKDLQGAPIAGYMNYAMHPVNAFLTGITSADFPGAACRYVEKAFHDDMVMLFTQGAAGDQNPFYLRPGTNAQASKAGVAITGYEMVRQPIESGLRDHLDVKPDPDVADNLERYIDALGVILGEEAIRVMTNMDRVGGDVRIWGTQEVITLPGRKRTNTGREGVPGTYEDGPPVSIRLGVLGIGNIALASIDAEIYNMFQQKLKAVSPMTNTVFVALANGRTDSGYIVPDSEYGKTTFQVLGNKLQPGHAERRILDTLAKMIEQYGASGFQLKQ